MKFNLLIKSVITLFFLTPLFALSQSQNIGTARDFAVFSTVGAVTNSGNSLITGHVGTNSGSSTGFGNVNGVMNDNNGVSAQCAADLLLAYSNLNSAIPTQFPSNLIGNGAVFLPGVYAISGATVMNLNLTLDAQNDENAVFIIQIGGAFSTTANSQVILSNGAKACNVFWKIEGMVSFATGTQMKGTVIANNGSIEVGTNSNIEGRVLSTAGAITLNGVSITTPLGCNAPILFGPQFPDLKSTVCYTIFSSIGSVVNSGVTFVTGDVGTNSGLTVGFDESNVTGMIHPIPDVSTAACAADLLDVYGYLNTLPTDIVLLYPAQFGNDLVLTPHTYLLNAATVLTNTLYLNAQNNPEAVFVIKINGALSTSTFSNVVLQNGAQIKNVFWSVNGAVDISENSNFVGTIIANNGAVNLTTGVSLAGRALSTAGSVTVFSASAVMPIGCTTLATSEFTPVANKAIFYPNPFTGNTNVTLSDTDSSNQAELYLFDTLGRQIVSMKLHAGSNPIDMSNHAAGIYIYKVVMANSTIQTGKLIAK